MRWVYKGQGMTVPLRVVGKAVAAPRASIRRDMYVVVRIVSLLWLGLVSVGLIGIGTCCVLLLRTWSYICSTVRRMDAQAQFMRVPQREAEQSIRMVDCRSSAVLVYCG
ncbi:hypothetical protein BDV32DRAFT_118527 [Aspergillus pseudonomiae]|uniref:Uncharacterized protein n=1 Tax=Aspergillus pseudonomiae TaxID=1506151 RepID=A0A5N7DG12_9EURO|nr:uncharacterized protein BDV37DRAFT_97905 [Aspergillus pseudonomiae]KAB8263846.1 hypothetical protein BDV32DRAFT_118527 [Aspergillus pseudonomiae]KAE8405149.1 hypothetical protein BDV37DRAFT_97905 [Aspergillus pseudonomiae]